MQLIEYFEGSSVDYPCLFHVLLSEKDEGLPLQQAVLHFAADQTNNASSSQAFC